MCVPCPWIRNGDDKSHKTKLFQVVSEDELPASKKEPKESRKRKPDSEGDGYDPGSPTSETELSNKKQAVAKVIVYLSTHCTCVYTRYS